MFNRLKETFSKSASTLSKTAEGKGEEAPVMTKGEAAFNFAMESGLIAGLKALQEQSGGAFRVVRETVDEETYKVEVNLPSWQRHPSNCDSLEKRDTTSITIRKGWGLFSASYKLSTPTNILWDESYYDFCSGRDVAVYSLSPLHERNSCEVTLRSLEKRAREQGLFDKKPQESLVEKQQETPHDKPQAPFRFRL